MENDPDASVPRAEARVGVLVGIFHPVQSAFGVVEPVPNPESVPEPHRSLLDHRSHMTAAMERFHRGPVALTVVQSSGPHREPSGRSWYAREILLSRPDGRVVQHGIVRLDLGALPAATAEAVVCAREPLGRLLMAAGVLCDVQDVALVKVRPGAGLATHLGQTPTFGRVATIRVDGRPAIELLEIVADTGDG
jgi:chorismate-pyruvate lyase